MKKILLLATTVFCFTNLINAQAGQLDPTFGNNGVVTTDLGKKIISNFNPSNILVQSDGSIYLINRYLTKRRPDGSVDTDFGLEINGYAADAGFEVRNGAIQPDGKIVVVGYSQDTLIKPALARFNSNGSLDSSFAVHGKQIEHSIPPGSTYFNTYDFITEVAVQKNGKIVVAGSSGNGIAIERFNSDGTLDNTFGGDGLVTNNTQVAGASSIAVQDDGKILIAINPDLPYGPLPPIIRYNIDGSLDKTFKVDYYADGSPYPTTKSFETIDLVAIQSDGKIVVEGIAFGGAEYKGYGAIGRYNTDGSLDNTFSNDGIQPSEGYVNITALALENDGKIILAGYNDTGNFQYTFNLQRYNKNGSLDESFSNDGRKTISLGFSEFVSLGIQGDGKIVAGGAAIARFNTDGSLDSTFDKDGKVTDAIVSGNTIFKSTAIQKDGKIVVAGRTWNGSNFDFAIARYNTDGSLDKTFSSDGAQTTDFGSKEDYANSVAIQNDGKIVVAGSSGKFKDGYLDSTNISIARYNTDGSLDNTFNTDPELKNAFSETGDKANSVAIQSDGKILIVGTIHDDGYSYEGNVFAVARLNADGSLDKTFDKDGKQTFVFSDNGSPLAGSATSVAIQNDGKIVIGGISGSYDAFISIARLNTDGSLDNTFGDSGKVNEGGYSDETYMSIAIQNDGKIVAGGYSYYRGNSDNFINRFDTNGKLDSSFSSDGRELTYFEANSDYPLNDFGKLVAIQSDGKIIVSGAAFTRYNTNGSLDSTFGNNGIQATKGSDNNVFINSIAIANNKLYGVGFDKSTGNVGLVARYLLDGTNTPPTVSLTAPANNATYLAPAAHIKLSAAATDKEGNISKVEFYNGATLLHTETVIPYGFVWRNVPLGNYTLTAKAYDNSGNVTTSGPVHISVVPNKAPAVSIIKPSNNEAFAAPAYIHFEAAANDTDGRITRVEFYNGSALLRTEYKSPYTYVWKNVPRGTYTITAVATDNWGAQTTSEPVTVRVVRPTPAIVSSRPSADNKTGLNEMVSLRLAPNPAARYLNVQTSGLQKDKAATISIISASGVVMKTMQINSLSQTQLDVSSLASGVYTIKVISGEKVVYKQFVKLQTQ
jgi:uncharacterized delta-60 repeat protein